MAAQTLEDRHRQLIADLEASGVTIDDLARAWASIDGKRDEFDRGKVDREYEHTAGHYDGYRIEAAEMVSRAVGYAKERRSKALDELVRNDQEMGLV